MNLLIALLCTYVVLSWVLIMFPGTSDRVASQTGLSGSQVLLAPALATVVSLVVYYTGACNILIWGAVVISVWRQIDLVISVLTESVDSPQILHFHQMASAACWVLGITSQVLTMYNA